MTHCQQSLDILMVLLRLLDGSLINPQSRLRTLPPISAKTPSPAVYLCNFERSWSYNCNNIYTAVGVDRVANRNSLVNGVLVELHNPSEDLPGLDFREREYIRKPVLLSDLFVETNNSFVQIDASDFGNCVVWVYENSSDEKKAQTFSPTPNVPIPQTYIDCIMQGCLLYSPLFAKRFVQLTRGWECSANGSWIDDRNSIIPKYKRRPEVGEISSPDCRAIDEVLKEVLGTHVQSRVVV
ncbi:hypothetical protein HK096_005794 [Nowakowskiella sp. JEL0078]|nr:hypothetical protein HK096_005794 [Nowakowskiella sp. JEL0078]